MGPFRLVVIFEVLLVGCLGAATLEGLRFKLQVREEVLEKPIKDLEQKYEAQLTALTEKLSGQGDLSGVLAVKREIETFRSATPADPAKIPDLRRLQNIYHNERKKRASVRSRARQVLYADYVKELEVLVVALTRDGQIEAATEADTELQAAMKLREPIGVESWPFEWTEKSLKGTKWRNEKGQEFTFLKGGVLRNLNTSGKLLHVDRWVFRNENVIEIRWGGDPKYAHDFTRAGNGREAQFIDRGPFRLQSD